MEHTENTASADKYSDQQNIYHRNAVKPNGNQVKLGADLQASKKLSGKKHLIENEPRAVIMLDQDGTIILIEGSLLEEFELDKYELIGNSVHLANPNKPLILKTISKAVLKEEKSSWFEANNAIYQVTIMPIWKSNREISGQIIIVTDITAIGESLKYESPQDSYYRQLFDNSKDAIAILDKNSKITDINESFHKLFGYTKKEARGKFMDELIVPHRLLEETNDIALIIEHGETAQFESIRKTKKGDEIEVSVTGSKIITSNGETGYCRIYSDISGRKKEEEQKITSQMEKEMLLKEIHHRVKNNLQMISSLLLLQSHTVKDKKTNDLLLESQNRIRSIALIHEKLYHTVDLSRIDFEKYLNSFIPQLAKSFNINSERIEITIKAENIFLNADTAIPCALIINELVSNSLRYAFPFDRKGGIEIELNYHKDNKITLTVKDDGVGINKEHEHNENRAISMELIGILLKQLEGRMDAKNDSRNEYKINFSIK